MKKYSKLIIAAIIALIFIGTFVFLWQKSQPKEVVYNEFTPKMEDIQKPEDGGHPEDNHHHR